MNKAFTYSLIAAMLGLALIIIPLHLAVITNAETRYPAYPRSLGLKTEVKYEETPDTSPKTVSEDLEILSISFFIAMGIYLFTRRGRPKRFYTWPPTVPH